MKQLLVLSLGLVIVLLGEGQVIRAGGAELPKGSYQNSCYECIRIGYYLICYCSYPDSVAPNPTYLIIDPKDTRDIANCLGVLQYGACPEAELLPPGSYAQSCKDCIVVNVPDLQQRALWCSCPTPGSSKYIKSGLILDPNKKEDIANCSGGLVYGSCTGVMPSGFYQQTCSNPPSLLYPNLPQQCFIKSYIGVPHFSSNPLRQAYALYCGCKDKDGRWVSAGINLNLRSGEQVNNCNGQLKVGNC